MELLLNIVANVLGVVAIALSTWAYIISKKETVYGDLDAMYLEVLKVGLEKPEFRNPNITSIYQTYFADDNDKIAYETYAFISINWCETCIDRVNKDKSLSETWYPAIRAEYRLHKEWIENPENHFKYKKEFRTFLKDNFGDL